MRVVIIGGGPGGYEAALADLRDAARGRDNLLVPMREALRHLATVGEVCDALREEFGTYRPADIF